VPRSWLPLAVAVRRDATGVSVLAVTAAAGETGGVYSTQSVTPTNPAWPDNAWQFVELPFESSWQVTLRHEPESAQPIVTVTHRRSLANPPYP
jgi:hypothetical protein